MSFSLSARFSQYDEYSPSPNSYNIHHISEKKKFSPWSNTCGLNLKCNGDCISSTCSRCFRNAHFPDQKLKSWKKPFHQQRYSLDPTNSWIENQNKILAENNNQMRKVLDSKKTESEVSQFLKCDKLPSPSFLNRPRTIHNCLKNESNNFIRNTAARKAVKPTKKKGKSSETFSEDSLELESNLIKNKLNTNSFAVLPKVDECQTTEELPVEKASSYSGGSDSSGAVKKWKGLEDLHVNINPDSTLCLVKDKDMELMEELSKPNDSTISDSEDQIIFLINEEFIDDDYDYYKNQIDEATHTQNPELNEVVRCLEEIKKGHSNPSLDHLESIIKAAIDELKDEFLNKIYKTTESKMDSLLEELKCLLLKAGGNVEDACNQTTSKLVSRLRNFCL